MTPLHETSTWTIECCECESQESVTVTRRTAIQFALESGYLELVNPNDATDTKWVCPECLAFNATVADWYNGWTAVDHSLRKENE